MHKIFAKPLFLGKKVVFLPQCHSTNDELTKMIKEIDEPEGLLVYTDDQIQGKGQRGNVWLAEPGKNILMSLLLRPKFLAPADQFYLNLVIGLAVVDTIRNVVEAEIELKWPNDVYLNDKKVAGILIENNLRGSSLESSVVGIGINVNQKGFALSTATSIWLESNSLFEREVLIEDLLFNVEKWYLKLKNGDKTNILDEYHNLLRWRGELHIFRSSSGEFEGEIIGIDKNGRLSINQSGTLQTFGIKEVEFLR
ncbi:biotin--[acetyl-CoA-carboxylase] ligase [Ekhidna sp.]